MNDVIPFYDGDTLHVFFNHNPKVASWGRFHWGHATTKDLVGWTTSPLALAPTPDGADGHGIWTGCVFATPDGAAALYTGISSFAPLTQVQCLAWSQDVETWEKRPDPVVATPPAGFGHCFRDPYVWRSGDTWRMLLGSTERERDVAAVLAYESSDLVDWEFVGPLYIAADGALSREAECPELFALGGSDVLVASCGQTRGLVGDLDWPAGFTPAHLAHTFDPGHSYAARSVDLAGRRIQIGWVRDTRSRAACEAAGWCGALSLPREVTVGGDGTLAVAPVAELSDLRTGQVHDGTVPVDPGRRTVLDGPHSLALELLVELEPQAEGQSGLVIGCDRDGNGGLDVPVDWEGGAVAGHPVGSLDPAAPLQLHVYVDRSIVEVFVLGVVITLRHYDPCEQARIATWSDGPASSCHVRAWNLAAG